MVITLRADHDIDGAFAPDDFAAFRLRHASGNDDAHLAAVTRGVFFGCAKPAQFRVYFFGCLLANVTGVENDEIRVIDARRFDKSLRCQRVHHALRIVDVHLTAE